MTVTAAGLDTDATVLDAIRAGATTVEEIVLLSELSKARIYRAIMRLSGAGLVTRRAPFVELNEDALRRERDELQQLLDNLRLRLFEMRRDCSNCGVEFYTSEDRRWCIQCSRAFRSGVSAEKAGEAW